MSTSADPQLNERALVFITSLGHAICHMGELIFPAVTVAVMIEFGLAPDLAVALGLLGYVLLGVGAIPMGAWADAWGPVRVMQVYFVLMALASVAVFFSSETWQLVVALTGLGLAASIYHPAALTMISLGVKRRGRAMGINGVAGSVGQAVGPWLGKVMAEHEHWRAAYLCLAGASVVAAGLMLIARRRLALQSPRTASVSMPVSPRPPAGWLPLCLLLSVMMLGGFNYRCLATALPPCFRAEEIFLILFAGGCAGQFLGGWAVDRFGKNVYPVFIALLVPLAALLAFVQGSGGAVGVAMLVTVFLFAQQPVENLLLADWSDRRNYSRSYGVKFALTFGVGASGAYFTGLVWKAAGSPAPVFYLVAGSGVVMLLLFTSALRIFARVETSSTCLVAHSAPRDAG